MGLVYKAVYVFSTLTGGHHESRKGAKNSIGIGGIAFFGCHLSPDLLHPADSDTGDTMMSSIYVALGIFLLIAVRNPSAHRSLIAFAAWSSFAHAAVMSILGLEIASQRVGFLIASAVLVVIGVALIALAPAKESVERTSAVVA